MRAVLIEHFGDPAEALRVVDLARGPLPPDQARIEIEAAARGPRQPPPPLVSGWAAGG
jgi:NADPH:quinone reductase-like Zn-dependent oxidoreductase